MADESCTKGCETAYQRIIGELSDFLLKNLIAAQGNSAQEAEAKENFERGMKRAREVRKICLDSCDF